ncbi:MAG: hypothetical protein NTY88_05800 [Bacteroidetes bacterium]|nr:hypothetical protein [Bacteroidota bacterium]
MKNLIVLAIALCLLYSCKTETSTLSCSGTDQLKVKFDSCKIICNQILDIRLNDYSGCGNTYSCFSNLDVIGLGIASSIRIDSNSMCFNEIDSLRYVALTNVSSASDVSPAYTVNQLTDFRKRMNESFDAILAYLK